MTGLTAGTANCASRTGRAAEQRRSLRAMARCVLALGILVLLEVVICGSARADGRGDEGVPRDPQARLLYDAGRAHLAAHRFAQAREALVSAAAVERSPATLLFLAVAEEKMRHFTAARVLLGELLEVAPDVTWRRAVEQRLSVLAQPWGSIHVTHPPGAKVTVDEVDEPAPNSVDVLPGFHVVQVDIGGRALTRRIEVAPGTGRALTLSMKTIPRQAHRARRVPTARPGDGGPRCVHSASLRRLPSMADSTTPRGEQPPRAVPSSRAIRTKARRRPSRPR